MKRLIAWDTSSKTGALVALEWDERAIAADRNASYRLVGEWALNVDAAQHSERLLWGVHQMLQACAWKLPDIDYFGVGLGPGSFTGLRIGLTTARTLALTLGKPLVGVSSLAALARPVALHFADRPERVIVVACTDAAKGELFSLMGSARGVKDCTVMADGDFPGVWKRGVIETVSDPQTLVKSVKKKLSEGSGKEKASFVRIGEGRFRYADAWKEISKVKEAEFPLPFADYVQGRYLGQLCYEAIQAGLARNPLEIQPRYLRVADAEKKLNAGLLKPAPQHPPISRKKPENE